jgi:hypothetical protein
MHETHVDLGDFPAPVNHVVVVIVAQKREKRERIFDDSILLLSTPSSKTFDAIIHVSCLHYPLHTSRSATIIAVGLVVKASVF